MPGTTITIKLEALTEEASAALQKFFAKTNAQLDVLPKAAASSGEALGQGINAGGKALDGFNGKLGKARMGLMELEHTARATVDVLLMGGSPRMLMAQVPQMLQGLTMLGVSLSTLGPIVLGVGAAIAGVAAGFGVFSKAGETAAEKAARIGQELTKVRDVLQQLNSFRTIRGITSGQALFYEDVLRRGPDARILRGSPTAADLDFLDRLKKLSAQRGPVESKTFDAVDPKWATELQKYFVEQGLLVEKKVKGENGKEESTFEASELAKSLQGLANVREELRKAQFSDETDKKIMAASEKYQKLIEAARAFGAVAVQSGRFSKEALDELIQGLDEASNAEVRDIEIEKRKEQEKKANESATAGVEERAKETRERLAELERQITLDQAKEGEKRGQNFENEYKRRLALIEQLRMEGVMTAKEEERAKEEADAKYYEARTAEAQRLIRLQESQQALELADVQGKRALVEGNPNLSDVEKRQQLLAIYQQEDSLLGKNLDVMTSRLQTPGLGDEARLQAEQRYQRLLQQRSELQQKIIDTEAAGTFAGEFRHTLVELDKEFGTWAQQAAHSFRSVFESAIRSISDGITGLIMGTKTWGQALRQIETTILTDVVQAIIQMGVRWVLTQIMMMTMGKALQAAAVAASAPMAVAASAIWATPATLAATATFGAAAAAAPAEILAAQAEVMAESVAAFASGGWVSGPGGPKSDSILARLSNGEFVVPADKAAAYAPVLNAIHNGTLDVGGVGLGAPHAASLAGGGGGGPVVNHGTDVQIAQFGGEAAAERWARSQQGEVFFHDMMKQHAWRYQKKG